MKNLRLWRKASRDLKVAAQEETSSGRLERIVLHAKCLWLDHKYRWHLGGIWREVSLH